MPSNLWLSALATVNGAGTAITSTTPASLLTGSGASSGKYTMPGGFLQIGTQLVIEAFGKISCVVTTPGTARFDVRFGSIVVFDGLAIPLNVVAKTNVGWYLRMMMTCVSVGNGTLATLQGQGEWRSQAGIGAPGDAVAGCGTFELPYNTAPGTAGNGFDSTVPQLVDLFFTQTVGTGSITLLQYVLRG